MQTKQNPLGTENISSLLVKFSIPAIIGMMVNALYNIVDRIYIGNASDIGSSGLAGITIAFPIMIILIAIGVLFGVGGATLFSMKLGEKKLNDATKVLGNSFTLLVISGLIFLFIGEVFLIPILKLFGASPEIIPYAESYMRVIFFGAIFQVVSMGMNHFLRADGMPHLAMVTMFVGAGTNILLDPLFIYVFKMGMAGAALATILSQAISMLWIISYFFTKKTNHQITVDSLKLNAHFVYKITVLGMPGFALQLASSVLNVVLNKKLVEYGGDMAISAMGVINSVQTVIIMPIIGLNQGVQPIVSFNYGAKQYKRIKETEKLAIISATIIVLIGFIVTRLFPKEIAMLFNRETELVNLAAYGMIAWFWMLPTVGFQILASNYFQAIGHSSQAMLLTLSRQVLFLLPAVVLLAHFYGLDGILYAAPLADLLSLTLTGILFYRSMKHLGEKEPKETDNRLDIDYSL